MTVYENVARPLWNETNVNCSASLSSIQIVLLSDLPFTESIKSMRFIELSWTIVHILLANFTDDSIEKNQRHPSASYRICFPRTNLKFLHTRVRCVVATKEGKESSRRVLHRSVHYASLCLCTIFFLFHSSPSFFFTIARSYTLYFFVHSIMSLVPRSAAG